MWSSRPDPCRAPRTSRGFSLLEVLVAFVVLSLVATAVFRLFSGALGNASAAEEYSRAVLIAQSVQSQIEAMPLREGSQSGDADDGRVQWTVQVTPYEAPEVNADLARASEVLPLRMYRIVTSVSFAAPNGSQRNISLSTIRIAAREQLP
ncbi:MAG TPA: prepilin-type N-terminal cleavage/methylation domain-containing protein [Casimicrobiaceae bacterium]|nr:prepilin-type N-terminal cleavage/methylation domain-containing protein [Casimicrobiaceae bacterium]